MTNYNERLDDLTSFMESIGWEFDENGYTFEDNYINFRTANILRQNINSLFKELVAEAEPGTWVDPEDTDDLEWQGYVRGVEHFEQNLLKALEEK